MSPLSSSSKSFFYSIVFCLYNVLLARFSYSSDNSSSAFFLSVSSSTVLILFLSSPIWISHWFRSFAVSASSLVIISFAFLARSLASSMCSLTSLSSNSNLLLASWKRLSCFRYLVIVGTLMSFLVDFLGFCTDIERGLTCWNIRNYDMFSVVVVDLLCCVGSSPLKCYLLWWIELLQRHSLTCF